MQCANDMREQHIDHRRGIKDKKRRTFLYLSRIINWKGLNILIEAFSRLEKERNDTQLIVGGDGPFKEYCVSLSRSLEINHIKFLGSIDFNKTRQIFEKADVFVLPSYFLKNSYEGWGLVINEAMSMRLPIITTSAVGAAYDLIENGKNGFIVEENSVLSLYNAMKQILYMNLDRMGSISRKIFEKENNFAKMTEGFIEAINYVQNKN